MSFPDRGQAMPKSNMYAHVPAVYSVYSYAVGQGWVKKPKAAKKTGMLVLSIIFVRALVLTL